jgi:hypothetical protein
MDFRALRTLTKSCFMRVFVFLFFCLWASVPMVMSGQDNNECFQLELTDAFGDGWNGAIWTIVDSVTGDQILTGTLSSGNIDLSNHCLPAGCYTFTTTSGSFPTEIGWTLYDIDGGPISGGAPESQQFSLGGACYGCTDPAACNYEASNVADDGSCCYQNCVSLEVTGGFFPDEVYWELVNAADNVVATGGAPSYTELCLPTGCYGIRMFDSFGNSWNDAVWTLADVINVIVLGTGTLEYGYMDVQFAGSVGGAGCVPGCIEPDACNFNPAATITDGSCTYPGCTDPAACNFSPGAGCDNGTCSNLTNCLNECINTEDMGVDFLWYYHPTIWDQETNGGNGQIIHHYGYLKIIGDNDSPEPATEVLTQVSADVTYTGTFTFDWSYYTVDGPLYDMAYYSINGVVTDLSDAAGANAQSGSVIFSANAGDVIAFGVNATDGCCGSGQLLVTKFTYPLIVCGCMDPTSCTYNPNATIDDGSCIASGCTHQLACNYDPVAICDNGTCSYEGCTDPTACNYDDQATCDSGNCVFNTGCLGSCYDIQGTGVDFTGAYFHDNWTISQNDGQIDHGVGHFHIVGPNSGVAGLSQVTDFVADASVITFSWTYYTEDSGPNYDPAFYFIDADVYPLTDDLGPESQSGSVTINTDAFVSIGFGVNSTDGCCGVAHLLITDFTYSDGICGCTDILACNYDPAATINDASCLYPGCLDPLACNFDVNAGCDSGYCEYPGCLDLAACNYDPSAPCNDPSFCFYPGCGDPLACNFDVTAGCDDGSCLYYGCTDPLACNYDALNGCEDGSCTYPGCLDTGACNYDPNAGCASGICSFQTDDCSFECVDPDGMGIDFTGSYAVGNWTAETGAGDGVIEHNTGSAMIRGNDNSTFDVLTQIFIVADVSGTYSFDWEYFTSDGPGFDKAYYLNATSIEITDPGGGNLQAGSIVFTANAGDIIGFGIDATDGCCGFGELLITNFIWQDDICGCDDPTACNYDPAATINDGSCLVAACLDPFSCNYDPNADCEDLSLCTYPGCTDIGACNYDSTAGCDDGDCAYTYDFDCSNSCIISPGVGVGFNQYYHSSFWTQSLNGGDGEIHHEIGSLRIRGNNNGTGNILTEVSIVVEVSGDYSFSWAYWTEDNAPGFDPAYYINGNPIELSDQFGELSQSGVV